MIQPKQYNVFLLTRKIFLQKNIQTHFIVAGLHFKNEAGVQLDTIHRFVIYFYDRR